MFGLPGDGALTVLEGDPARGRFVGCHRTAGEPTAILGWNMPKQARLHRQRLLPLPAPLSTVR